jgi:A/G-specific adenine glycosylase
VGGDAYAIWLSEIMLQQTQVATVSGYFERFLRALPTVEALAAAEEQDVLRLWEGLGYYRRARQLHRAARLIVSCHGGQFPRQIEQLRRLPGIGRYTAGAILSIAFDQPQPILEANTSRLFSRLLAYRGDPRSAAGQKLCWAMAETLVPQRQAGRFNQALMELGSTLCQPRAPRCERCPVVAHCGAFAAGLQTQIPPPLAKPATEAVREAAVVVRRRGRVLLIQNPEGRRWAGLWDFPRFALESRQPAEIVAALRDGVRKLTGVHVEPGACWKTLKHGVTRFRITLDCYQAEYVRRTAGKAAAAAQRWLRPAELDNYPLCTTGRRLARLVQKDVHP